MTFYFHVLLFSFAVVMVFRSLVHREWDNFASYLVLMACTFMSISFALNAGILSMVNAFEGFLGGLP